MHVENRVFNIDRTILCTSTPFFIQTLCLIEIYFCEKIRGLINLETIEYVLFDKYEILLSSLRSMDLLHYFNYALRSQCSFILLPMVNFFRRLSPALTLENTKIVIT